MAFYGISLALQQAIKTSREHWEFVGFFKAVGTHDRAFMRRSCRLCDSASNGNPPAQEANMKRQFLISGLIGGAALALLGGCASYDDDYYGRGYSSGGVYYGGSYYDPDYYGYYGPRYYGHAYIPYGGYGGGYRYRHDSDRYRDHDGDRGDRRGYHRGDTNRDVSRNQPQQNTQPSQPSGGHRDGGSGDRSSDRSGDRPSGGPEGRFGHPGTHDNPL